MANLLTDRYDLSDISYDFGTDEEWTIKKNKLLAVDRPTYYLPLKSTWFCSQTYLCIYYVNFFFLVIQER